MTSEENISMNPSYDRQLSPSIFRGLLLLFLIATAGAAKGDSVTLDFEGFPDSTILTTQYPGLTFTNTVILTAGISLNELEFPPHSGVNVASDNNGPITIDFSTPITSFSGYFTYVEPLIVVGLDASDDLVAFALSMYSSNDALFGDIGSSPNEFITVSFDGGISSVGITGDPEGGSFVMDDITYTTAVPEPAGFPLMLLGGAMVILPVLVKRNLHRNT